MRACVMALLIIGAVPAAAQNSTAPAQAVPPAIETQSAATSDRDITARIRGIYAEIEALGAVQVRTSAGVVTLSGTVPGAGDPARAEAIASRVAGVVTVENEVSRDLKVKTNLSPALGQFGNTLRGLVRALPLIGVAIGIGILIALLAMRWRRASGCGAGSRPTRSWPS